MAVLCVLVYAFIVKLLIQLYALREHDNYNPMEAIALWRPPIEACLRPACCSCGRSTVARPTAPRKTRLMDRPALRAKLRSPPPPLKASLALRITFRLLRGVLGLGAIPGATPGATTSSKAPQAEPVHRTGASLTTFSSVDDVDTEAGEDDGGGGVPRISLIEVLPSVLGSPSSWHDRRFPTITRSSCLSDGLFAGSCTGL